MEIVVRRTRWFATETLE